MTWDLLETPDDTHIVPPKDVVGHTLSIDCQCKPYRDRVCRWVVIHLARDNRPQYQPDEERRQ